MQKVIAGCLFFVCAVVVVSATYAEAETTDTTNALAATVITTSVDDNISRLESLMAQIELLKKKLAELTRQMMEAKAQLRADLSEGSTGDDVKKLQALLASDPTLYPEGLKTGYFGPLTREALKRFQLRHEIEVTGVIDEATKALLEEYLADAGNAGIPVGFLRAPGMQMKIEMRFSENCERHGEGNGAFCNKMKIKYEVEDDNSDGDEESDDDKGDVVDGSTDAIEAIADAIAVIDALKAAVEVSTEKAEVIDDAEAAVKAAEIALASAQAKLAVDALDEAETFASEAERVADDAYEVLVGEEFESERNVDEKGDDESNDETLLEGDE